MARTCLLIAPSLIFFFFLFGCFRPLRCLMFFFPSSPGMQAAFNQAAKDYAKLQAYSAVQAEIAALQAKGAAIQQAAGEEVTKIAAQVKSVMAESDQSVAVIDAETDRIEKVKDDAFKALTAARALTGPTRDQQVRAAEAAYSVANDAHSARLKSFSALKDAAWAKRDAALAALSTQREAVWAKAKVQTDAIAEQVAAKSQSMNGSMKDMTQLMDSFGQRKKKHRRRTRSPTKPLAACRRHAHSLQFGCRRHSMTFSLCTC